jgi:UDP-N-acetylmuramoyl-L-alanyl-D-glutamate--2,6-diaminopimelate ligase
MRQTQGRSRTARLREIFPQAPLFLGDDVAISGCTSELAQAQPGDLFVGIVSPDADSHEQADKAIAKGAVAVLTERMLPVDVTQVVVDDSRVAMGQVCHALADFPSRKLPVIGVTGTHGKTTTSLLIASVLNTARQGVAALTSLAHCDSVDAVPAEQTTPGPQLLSIYLASAIEHGCSHGVVELSSAGLAEHRAAGMELAVAVLTNLRRAHTDRHHSAAAYRAAKLRIFDLLRENGVAILNADDPATQSILNKINRPALTFGLHSQADVTATVLERTASEQTFYLEAGNDSVPVCTKMIGDHHIYNCLAAAAVGLLYGLPLATIARGLEAVESIPGRMERIECGQDFRLFVDEAGTHDSLAMCLKAARQVTTGRIICVTSAGNDPDPAQRALLGRVLEKSATLCAITGESGKAAKSLAFAHDVLDGFQRPGKAHVIPSRDKAIRWAMEQAREGDTVVICGAGHRGWKAGRRVTDDASLARQELQKLVAQTSRLKPIVYAFSG